MSLLSTLQQNFGFTRNEIKVILLLSGTFLAGLGIRWYQSTVKATSIPPHRFDYSRSDSVFRARSKALESTASTGGSGQPTRGALKSVSRGRTVNINTASKAQLIGLPGIGPAYAERIIRYRLEHGGFGSIEDLQKVSGIGKKKFDRLKEYVTVQ